MNWDARDWSSLALALAWGWNFWRLIRERAVLEKRRQRLADWSDSLSECNRAVAALYDQLAERYPDDADIQKCREIYAGKHAQH